VDRDSISLQEALRQHLLDNGLPADGGVSEKWAVVRVGPIPVCFPNIKARRKATALHDLNHLLSGYGHDAVGEAEISAWELGGGCKSYWVAWLLDWGAIVLGIFTAPGRLLRAFARGRRTGNLYGADINSLLQRTVHEVTHDMGLDLEYPVRMSDVALFVGIVCLAPIVGAIPGAAAVVTSPWWLAEGAHKRRRSIAAG
jgi:hypothetical protein